MKINDKIHGFEVINIQSVESLEAELVEMCHEKTGAKLAWLNSGEENKLFSISFKTVPEDDTGVFHILEHSVLGGSENYPVKEPFLYMLKSSMNTFLNAMTFPDKTMFPISSRNNTDFMNLTKVYLDAVFKPEIYTNPCIFYQEGHHTEYRNNDDTPIYKGVVFNEMKGVVSSVDERIESKIMSMLFPESCYRFEYGGLPEVIPDLTYKQFVDTHKRFYHPSNSYIYLDGDIDINAVLELINSYLSEYEYNSQLPEIPVQNPINSAEKTEYYEISPDEPEENRTYLTVGKVLASWEEREKIFAYDVLCEALTGSNDAPLKRAVLDTGLCRDMELVFSNGIAQPFGMLKVSNINKKDGGKILDAVKSMVKDLTENGIDRDILSASINRCEFRFRESEEPKGLTRCIDAMSSWLYGGNPLKYIDSESVFEFLREKIDTGYFEKLLAYWLLDENHRALLYMIPSHVYGEEQKKKEQERLENELALMSDEEKTKLIKLNNILDEWQEAPDTSENITKLPTLSLSEVSENPIDFKTTEEIYNNIKILHHPAKNKGIISVNLYFDISDLNRKELETIAFMERVIAELPTKQSTGAELQQKITGILGSFCTDITALGKSESPEICKTFFTVKMSFLERNIADALKLAGEIITETVYNNSELIKELLMQDDEEMKHDIIADGHRFAMRRARGGMSAESAVNEFIKGFEAYRILHALTEQADEKIPEFIRNTEILSERIFCKSRLTVSVTSSDTVSLDELLNIFPDGEKCLTDSMNISALNMDIPECQGIVIPAGVSYSGAVLSEINSDKAVWNVLSTILTYEYLWNEVRVKGGAYGTGSVASELGETAFYSFRDPSPDKTLGIFADSAEFISEYCDRKPDISSYIISSIAKNEPLISDSEYGLVADNMYFRGISYDDRKEIRRNMLSLTYKDLSSAVMSLEKHGNCCII
ncbi:MAG: insulinase family protein, partial [Ruminococcus sp.]|nr:insulinase family protein [Ruminococcus sp.]